MAADYKMDSNEIILYNAIKENAEVFLKDGIKKYLNMATFPTQEEASLLVATIQTCIELSCKASYIKKFGIKKIAICDSKKSTKYLLKQFKKGSIKLKDYNWFKAGLKDNYSLFHMAMPEDINKLTNFQYYRNRIMHFRYEFNEKELKELRFNIVYILRRIILNLLFEFNFKEMRDFLYFKIGEKERKMLKDETYREMVEEYCLEMFGEKESLYCPICGARTLVYNDYYGAELTCLNCIYDFEEVATSMNIRCPLCERDGLSAPVIYDTLNLDYNNNKAIGLCLSCREEYYIHVCPNCGDERIIDELEYNDKRSEIKCPFCDYVDISK